MKLSKVDGTHLGAKEIHLPAHSSVLWEGIFDTRRYVQRYEQGTRFAGDTAPATAHTLLERLGEFLGEEVLGEDIMRALTGPGRRVLVVRLPTTDEDVLAAALPGCPGRLPGCGTAPGFETSRSGRSSRRPPKAR